jgi:rhamnosyltransferase
MSSYIGARTSSWRRNIEGTTRLAERLKLNCRLSIDNPPFALGTAFWCRTAALKTLFEHEFEYEDFPPEPIPGDHSFSHAFERIFTYAAQHEGYYSGMVMTDEYAELYSLSFQYMFDYFVYNQPRGAS